MKPIRLKLVWEKQSNKRYSANCGPGHVDVREVGIRDINRHWIVGEVFGRGFHDCNKYPCPDTMGLVEAQAMAECVAVDMISALKKSPLGKV